MLPLCAPERSEMMPHVK